MRRLVLVVLAALGAAACNPPDPYPEVTAATYEVTVSVVLKGTTLVPGKGDSDAFTEVNWVGSAVAVSADGDLLTARHVVSLTAESPTLCQGFAIDWNRMALIRNVSVVSYQLTVIGPGWFDRYSGTAAGSALKDWCDENGNLNLEWSPDSTATLRSADSRTDLALLDLKAEGIPHLQVGRKAPTSGNAVLAAGTPRLFREPVVQGSVFLPCVMRTHARDRVPPMPVVEFLTALERGMSGGPVVYDGKVAGISVMVMMDGDRLRRSYAIYGPYVAAWYDWTKKPSVSPRPEPVCP